jgi:Ca2+-binding EF-hand superfamily protein
MKTEHQLPVTISHLQPGIRRAAGALVSVVVIALSGCATNKSQESTTNGVDRFAQADTNHDGKLSRNEASDYLVIEIFNSRDANHDGRMTEQEWTGGDPGRLADFKKRDANHDGIVTKQEAMAYGRAHGIVIQIFKEADKNHDGYLDRAEAKAYFASRE